jgi:uncharacterized protein YbcV (DUF1398 family)
MFSIEQIKQAHSKVKSGADFPGYIQELRALGVMSYDNYVTDGTTKYFGANNFTIMGSAKYPAIEISPSGSESELALALAVHQAGGTDYLTFCKQAATFGVEKWTVDIGKMTCVYFDESGREMISEKIPGSIK